MEESYAGLFWGTVIPEQDSQKVLDLLADKQASAQLCLLTYRTWTLDSGQLGIGVALPGTPQLPSGFVAAARPLKTVPASWFPENYLSQAQQPFRVLQQVALAYDVVFPPGELLYVHQTARPFIHTQTGANGTSRARHGTLLDCLSALEEFALPQVAVQVPAGWGLECPYWSPSQLIGVLTEPMWECPAIALEHYATVPARLVLVQDEQAGIFAEIHCIAGQADGVISILPVLYLFSHTAVREWMQLHLDEWKDEAMRYIEANGLLDF